MIVKILPLDAIENNVQKETYEKLDISEKKLPVIEPTFKKETVDNSCPVDDLKDTFTETASVLVQKVVDKIENEIEINVQKEELKGVDEDKPNETPLIEPTFTDKIAGEILHMKDDLAELTKLAWHPITVILYISTLLPIIYGLITRTLPSIFIGKMALLLAALQCS